jgi:hypothetical protein
MLCFMTLLYSPLLQGWNAWHCPPDPMDLNWIFSPTGSYWINPFGLGQMDLDRGLSKSSLLSSTTGLNAIQKARLLPSIPLLAVMTIQHDFHTRSRIPITLDHGSSSCGLGFGEPPCVKSMGCQQGAVNCACLQQDINSIRPKSPAEVRTQRTTQSCTRSYTLREHHVFQTPPHTPCLHYCPIDC